MDSEALTAVKACHAQLKGFLAEAPEMRPKATSGTFLADALDEVIVELSEITGKDYSRFGVRRVKGAYSDFVYVEEYRNKLGGLVGRIEQEYGIGEPSVAGGPGQGITVNLNQTLQQTTQMILNLELTALIEGKLADYPEGGKERTFLERLKASLGSAKDVAGLIQAITGAAAAAGLGITEIAKILGVG